MSVETLETLAKKPFDDEDQIGSNCRKEDNFLELKHVLAAANDPNSNLSGINWPDVSRLSAEILGNESKDILVACYLAVGLLKTEDLIGLVAGLGVVDNLISDYWEHLYPPLRRLNGRWSAFEWLIEQLSDFLESFEGQRPKSEVDPVIEQFKNLDKSLSGLSEEAPTFLPLIRNFERIIALEKEESKPEEEISKPENDEPEASGLNMSAGQITSVSDALEKQSNLWENAKIIADYLKENNAEPEIAYRLARMSIWQIIRVLPPSDNEFITRVPPPDRNLVKQLNLLLDADNQQGIIDICEGWAIENPYWFELNFKICSAFEMTGKLEVSRSIKCELLALYHRFPDIVKLKFSDKALMIGQQTLAWLQEDLATSESTQTISADNRENLTDTEKKFFDELDKIHQKSKTARLELYAKIHHYLDSDISENLKVELLIEMLDSMIPSKNEGLIKAYMGYLEEKLESFNIECWDKVLASKILLKLIEAKKSLNESHDDYYHRLCRVDMLAAIASHK
ncbi:TssA family type VI secretion system protein [Francisellaceae bacterium]|nr:TssA family type VI secretion system protein [Francisellaceae bacterium]